MNIFDAAYVTDTIRTMPHAVAVQPRSKRWKLFMLHPLELRFDSMIVDFNSRNDFAFAAPKHLAQSGHHERVVPADLAARAGESRILWFPRKGNCH